MIPHPTDRYKYVNCEYTSVGSNKGWSIHIMSCAPGTQNCIQDDELTAQTPTTESPDVTKDIVAHEPFKCYKQGIFPHPTYRYKYVVCDYGWF
jgi:hypothetical protein